MLGLALWRRSHRIFLQFFWEAVFALSVQSLRFGYSPSFGAIELNKSCVKTKPDLCIFQLKEWGFEEKIHVSVGSKIIEDSHFAGLIFPPRTFSPIAVPIEVVIVTNIGTKFIRDGISDLIKYLKIFTQSCIDRILF